MKDKFNGWHIVALALIAAGLIGWLVHEGQQLGVIITGVLGILGALGFTIAQNQENKNLANGNLAAMRDQMAEKDRQALEKDKLHAEEMARKDAQFSLERSTLQSHIKEANDKAAAYAAMAPPDPKVMESIDGMARIQ